MLNKVRKRLTVGWQATLATTRNEVFYRTVGRHPTVLKAALAIRRRIEARDLPEWMALGAPDNYLVDLRGALEEVARLRPAANRIGLLANALLQAQTLFALRDCGAPTREDVLTGLLRAALSEAIDFCHRRMPREVQMEEERNTPIGLLPFRAPEVPNDEEQMHIFAVDLAVRGREARTGADIAFIIDVGTSPRPEIVVAVLQAKRGNNPPGTPLDVARRNKTFPNGDGQLIALRKMAALGCGAAYLIYNNDPVHPIEVPVLPIVKEATALTAAECATLLVDLDTDTVDLAHYLLHLATHSDRERFESGKSPKLVSILKTLIEDDARHLVALSPNPEFGAVLNNALGLDARSRSFAKPTQPSVSSVQPDLVAASKPNRFAD